MSGSEAIDMVERGGHGARHRRVILPAQERVEPNQPAGAALQTLELDGQRASGLAVIATNEERELDWGDRVVRLG